MPQNIQHIVVLMMENRSFDHMLGYLKGPAYPIDGLTGSEWNPVDPANPTERVPVTNQATYVTHRDPGHSFHDVNIQLFANPAGPPPVGSPNMGFVFSYAQQLKVTPDIARTIMDCFDPSSLPVLAALAKEFCVCDQWFASVPGPTWPNRFFVHAATSKGYLDNSQFHNYDMLSIFENIAAQGLTWTDYFHDFSQTWALQRLQTDEMQVNFKAYADFRRDALAGRLPNYSFIEPKYFWWFGSANDEHPAHDVLAGESLIADVYNQVRASPVWDRTLLVILYDEHGGFYDHVPPRNATPPDSFTLQFGFDRYGIRVPAVLVSPYIPRGTIDHRVFDHTSVPATIRHAFGLGAHFLTHRDESATTFCDVPSLDAPRTDTPASVGSKTHLALAEEAQEGPDPSTVAAMARAGRVPSEPLSEFQQALVDLAGTLGTREPPQLALLKSARRVETEYDGAVYVREVAARFLARSR